MGSSPDVVNGSNLSYERSTERKDFNEEFDLGALPPETQIQISSLRKMYPGFSDFFQSFNISFFPSYEISIIGPRNFLEFYGKEIGELRYKTFVEKLGWNINTVIQEDGASYDIDRFDLTSLHILVKNADINGEILASVRLQLAGKSTISKILSEEDGFKLDKKRRTKIEKYLDSPTYIRGLVASLSGLMSTTSELNNDYSDANKNETVVKQLMRATDPKVIDALHKLGSGHAFEIQRLILGSGEKMLTENFPLTLCIMSTIAKALGTEYAFGQSDNRFVDVIRRFLGEDAIKVAATTTQLKSNGEPDIVHLLIYDIKLVRGLLKKLKKEILQQLEKEINLDFVNLANIEA